MNEKVLKTLEYNKIIDMLVEKATCPGGRELCKNLTPATDLDEIRQSQQHTKDALSRIFQKGSLSFSGTHDLGASLKRLSIGGTLNIEELLRICSLLEVAKRAKNYSRKDRDSGTVDSLDHFFSCIEPLTPLYEEIRRCILSEDEIADNASPGLKNVRRSIRNINDRIRTQMNTMLNNNNIRTYLQDNVITMRGGRYCLPVRAESKSHVPGMIHDQSSSGSTLFIEPMAVVKLNNDLKELFLKEEEEIETILANLSNLTAEHVTELIENISVMITLDFIFAKASLAKSYNGIAPTFNTDGQIRIRKGRHPLLNAQNVVPIDIHLGETFDLLIVTGPNTGGKTVSIKTVGLFTLMGQAGLHIPAADRSKLAVFDDVYADIGDEQSIEQSLSTFSSHMTNIISILDAVNNNSLVLFDELCAGTDPTEGAALAISILSRLHQRQIPTMATTHYSELKIFALSTPRVENACCEFSVENLSPTYRLLIGIPGKSNAFAISGKLGLPAEIIDDARNRMDAKDENFEDLVSDLELKRLALEKEQLDIEKYKEDAKEIKDKLAQKQDRLDRQRDNILQKANEEAHAILRNAKEVADETIKNFHKFGSGSSAKEMEQHRDKLRDQMNHVEKNLSIKPKEPQNHRVPKKLRLGDSVKVLSLNLKGTVHTLPNEKGDLYVQMGILRSLVNIRDLVLLEDNPPLSAKQNSPRTGKINISKAANLSSEINLIGKKVDEAIPLLDKYIDDAYLAHVPSVRIVHGKGTGALRNAVHSHLKRLNHVKSFRLGEFGEGDSGVTIAEFK
jgi:DNA mismatch repair protein MutS2